MKHIFTFAATAAFAASLAGCSTVTKGVDSLKTFKPAIGVGLKEDGFYVRGGAFGELVYRQDDPLAKFETTSNGVLIIPHYK